MSLVRREWVNFTKKDAKKLTSSTLEVNSHDRYFITSLPAQQAKSIAQKVRNHWSVENKNHYRKDVSLWLEDDHRHRRVNTAQNLALMRSALMTIIPFDQKLRINDLFHDYQRKPHLAIRLIQKSLPI